MNLKPFNIKPWYAIIGILGLIGSVAGSMAWIKPVYEWAVPSGEWLNYRLLSLILTILLVVTFLVMNQLWWTQYEKCIEAELKKENYYQRLTTSEQARLMDFQTGLPNGEQFKKELESFYEAHPLAQAVQVAMIDIRSFKQINTDFGHNKADVLLRRLAQSILKTMRRNESMFRYPESPTQAVSPNTYRRYNGGDEFLLLIEGDQAEALGFINRLHRMFGELTPLTKDWLGREVKLSFICSLVPFERADTHERVMEKLGQCYTVASHSIEDYSICWFDEL
jgi:diguanylate cyclase (GGDEF)-like protein